MVEFRAIAPQFVVPDVKKAAEYYRDVLGFEILDFFQDPPVFAMVRRGGVEIHFGRADEPEPFTNSTVRRDGLDAYIFVDDCDAVYRDLKHRGAVITQPPIDRPYGCREIVVLDCFGFRLAFGAGA
jgi:uncharacterized glyoxalase superfamily protein PhnB